MKKKVIVRGPALSRSGYGEMARLALQSLRQHKEHFDVSLLCTNWGRTGNIPDDTEESGWINKLIVESQKRIQEKEQFDISIQISIPNEFEKMAPINIGYTAGIETTKVSPQWIEKTMLMDKLIVISEHSKQVFNDTVYQAVNQQTNQQVEFRNTKPIDVVGFPVKKLTPAILDLGLSCDFNFLAVAQWGPRKNLEATVRAFVEEFKTEEVGLVLKTNTVKNCIMDRTLTELRLKNLLATLPQDRKCKIHLLHGNMSDEEVAGLYVHPKIKAFVSTTHGEGFGIPMFEAAAAGLPIAAPFWSGQTDFLKAPKKNKDTGKVKMKSHCMKIDFELKPVQTEAVWNGVIQADSKWAFVKPHSVRLAMREMVKNLPTQVSTAKKLQDHILKTFTEEAILKQFAERVLFKKLEDLQPTKIEPSAITGLSFCIPTHGKRLEKTLLTIKSIKKQDWNDIPHEIIICGDVENFKDIDGIILVDKKIEAHNRKVSVLRNSAADVAKYDVVFCDDDVILDKKWLDGLNQFSKNEGWQVLGNKVLSPDGTRYWDRSLLNPHVLVEYDHPKEDSRLYQSSAFFLIRKEVFEKVRWDETKLVFADKEGGIPEDVQYSLDLVKNNILLSFNKSSLVWHNDDTYTEFSSAEHTLTLKKNMLKEKFGFEFFLPEDQGYALLVEDLKQ